MKRTIPTSIDYSNPIAREILTYQLNGFLVDNKLEEEFEKFKEGEFRGSEEDGFIQPDNLELLKRFYWWKTTEENPDFTNLIEDDVTERD